MLLKSLQSLAKFLLQIKHVVTVLCLLYHAAAAQRHRHQLFVFKPSCYTSYAIGYRCKTDDMINVGSTPRKCFCGRAQPNFAHRGQQKPTHCAKCKEPGMVNIRASTCQCGKAVPSFGVPGQHPSLFCFQRVSGHVRLCNSCILGEAFCALPCVSRQACHCHMQAHLFVCLHTLLLSSDTDVFHTQPEVYCPLHTCCSSPCFLVAQLMLVLVAVACRRYLSADANLSCVLQPVLLVKWRKKSLHRYMS